MKNLACFIAIMFFCFSLPQLTAQQNFVDQPSTPDYHASGVANMAVPGEFGTVGNSGGPNGSTMQFYSHTAAGIISSFQYFHPAQEQLEVIDIVYTGQTCSTTNANGYYVTGNATAPGSTAKHVFVAQLDATGIPIWYREINVGFNGTAKAIIIGQVDPTPTDPNQTGQRVYVLGMDSPGVPFAAALDQCGNTAWGPFNYGGPNDPQRQAEDITFSNSSTAGPQVVFTGSELNAAGGGPATWVTSLDPLSGAVNWSNQYPAFDSFSDQGYAIAADANDIMVVGRAENNNDLDIYAVKLDPFGNPLYQHRIASTSTANALEWGEDVRPSNIPGHFFVLGRDGATGQTILMELDATGVPGAEVIYPMTQQGILRDQMDINPLGGLYISSNTMSGSGDYFNIFTAGGVLPPPCGPDPYPMDYVPTQGMIGSQPFPYQISPWESLQLQAFQIQLNTVDPCEQTGDICEVNSDFCFDVVNSTVNFSNYSFGNGTVTYEWDFGDGNTSTAMDPTHTYPTPSAPMTYTVCLTVINTMPDGTVCCYTCCKEITINPPCYDNIPGPTFNYLYKNNGSIKFNNPSGAGGAFTKTWTINGVFHSNLNQPPSITLPPGIHIVCLEITKNSNPNCTEKFCRNILVDPACDMPKSGRIAHATCLNSTTVDFEAIVGGTTAAHVYEWDFGDGNTGSGQVITHTYSSYGDYLVCVDVIDGNCMKRICHMISVSAPACSDSCSSSTRMAGESVTEEVIDELNKGTELQIMPNPVRGQARAVFSQIEGEKASISISDMNGQLIQRSRVAKGDRNYEFDLSNKPSGMYIMTLQLSNGKVISSKIMKD